MIKKWKKANFEKYSQNWEPQIIYLLFSLMLNWYINEKQSSFKRNEKLTHTKELINFDKRNKNKNCAKIHWRNLTLHVDCIFIFAKHYKWLCACVSALMQSKGYNMCLCMNVYWMYADFESWQRTSYSVHLYCPHYVLKSLSVAFVLVCNVVCWLYRCMLSDCEMVNCEAFHVCMCLRSLYYRICFGHIPM